MITRSLPSAFIVAVIAALTLTACDALDPTQVENPRTTDEDLAQAERPTAALLDGMRAQFARALGAAVVTTELASDNASIHGTGLGGNTLDFPRQVTPNTSILNCTFVDCLYWNLQELRSQGDFLIEDIAPEDDNATDAQIAEAHYYRGMAFLMQGENFTAVPTTADSAAVLAAGLLANAQRDFSAALDMADAGSDLAAQINAGLARTHRALGNVGPAQNFAQAALNTGGNAFLYSQPYDAQNLGNPPHDYLVQRALQEMQPLPRLDFLDPKYTQERSPIPYATAEEMRLILAETALANDNPSGAKSQLRRAIDLADRRETVTFEDGDARLNNNSDTRPDTSVISIRFSPGAPPVDSLVLTRPGTITIPTVSGTHVTKGQVTSASGTDLTRLLYLLRQEIMYLEGHRLHDLGIRLPMMLREIDTSPVLESGDMGTEVSVPDYIPSANEMDLYEPNPLYGGDGRADEGEALRSEVVTMLHDMNRVLAEERGLVIENPMVPGQ
ncbi:hypothetical protein BSZ35_08665 [Salinibacter sp. 10B]|uniref:hypothetical protein n=1 Tax=Salinibacter sp. 10B TaxID=1923971 RepID=UPI000CF3C39C|nr:hypothetical protein [Salinibacter sp. 10B]PQJ34661.1 hypothetical protein BSZ35_08665 [Salinibacter sp. 10B]